jgi:TPR repeat protein
MSFLSQFGFGRSRKTEDLERHVSRLQAAVSQSSEVAGRWTVFRREVTGAIAVLMLALGFTLGAYREPFQQAAIGLAQTLGFARGSSDAAYAAYQEGRYATALRLARPLAAEGDALAQSVLGLLYRRGLGGVPQDKAEAVKWFRRAADQGDAQAQYNLGLSYAKGEAVEQDDVSAHMWFNLAAAHFPVSDNINRIAARKDRDLVAEKMTPDQIAEAEKFASEWRPKLN